MTNSGVGILPLAEMQTDAPRKRLISPRYNRFAGIPPSFSCFNPANKIWLHPAVGATLRRCMNPFALLAPVFLVFELGQLFLSERYMGIRQIRVNADPRELPMARWMSTVWLAGLIVYFIWMCLLLFQPVGRAQGVVLLAVTAIGYSIRSSCGIKWILVVLTFEGSIRIGMLLYLMLATWQRLGR
jgi:hypothetical protein